MAEPYIGEIKMFAGNFAPRGWAFCDGQLLAVSSNDALFSLFGTIYGGDGRTTFGLPDMRGRIPVQQGSGPGLSNRRLGSKVGRETETLAIGQIPLHNHDMKSTAEEANSKSPVNAVLAKNASGHTYSTNVTDSDLQSSSVTSAGSSQNHDNMMPSLCVNFIVALVGIYPSRN